MEEGSLISEEHKKVLEAIAQIANVDGAPEQLQHLWKLLLEQQPSNDDLVGIIMYVDTLRMDAWKQLRMSSPAMEDLGLVCTFVPEAFEILSGMQNSRDVLLNLMIEVPELREKAWVLFIRMSPTPKDLIRVMSIAGMRTWAWNELLRISPSKADLCSVGQQFPDLLEQVALRLLTMGPSEAETSHVFNVSSLHDAAISNMEKRWIREAVMTRILNVAGRMKS